ncbi:MULTISPECIES: hypothetical protein [unclassified Streptomyces]|uniref:hypothetical protein n=1 Tax=unclassified Streptomyces TaxID=2593676 RepID=UPI000888EBF2|nr:MULTISPECIES: hypothetical protein [unclassified Streptomyces]PBC86524.1 hypothetical protein BX261_6619 [Streptomyces sp. 2321.6]SDQ81281.1 hypothetical protein SAMN05216511_0631 [Streptomyces sp. KS_16]SEE01257.1 hypothetical protein SAMN05428940_6647 [Streptomyces sp. 2133.1]SNC73531.1 hypothetical protein SAMN06272741_6548 [Streptomyces sp. 2114.4]
MTLLPYTLYDGQARIGPAPLRFPLAAGLAPFLGSVRFPRREDGSGHLAPRRRGEPAERPEDTPPGGAHRVRLGGPRPLPCRPRASGPPRAAHPFM